MLAQHMLGNRAWCFQLWMSEGSPDLVSIMQWDPGMPRSRPRLRPLN